MRALTERQRQVLDFLHRHLQTHGLPPTLHELMHAFGWASPAGAAKHLQARLATLHSAVGAVRNAVGVVRSGIGVVRGAEQTVVVGAVPAGAVRAGEEVLRGAGCIANVAVGEVRAADPNTTNPHRFFIRRLALNIRHGGHAFFGHEFHPHAGQNRAGVDASAGGFGTTVGGHRVQPQRSGGGEQVGAGGGASKQDSGEGAERLVNFSAQVRVGVRAFEQFMELSGHQGDKPACRTHVLNRLQENFGAKVHGLNDGAGNDRGGTGEYGACEHLCAGNIVRRKSQEPLRCRIGV